MHRESVYFVLSLGVAIARLGTGFQGFFVSRIRTFLRVISKLCNFGDVLNDLTLHGRLSELYLLVFVCTVGPMERFR